jgi:hypothetical protein
MDQKIHLQSVKQQMGAILLHCRYTSAVLKSKFTRLDDFLMQNPTLQRSHGEVSFCSFHF